MLRAAVLQGRRAEVNDWDDDATRREKAEAFRIITEHNLVAEAGVTLEQLGYTDESGQVFAWKIDEHLLAARFMSEAQADAARQRRSRKR